MENHRPLVHGWADGCTGELGHKRVTWRSEGQTNHRYEFRMRGIGREAVKDLEAFQSPFCFPNHRLGAKKSEGDADLHGGFDERLV